MKNIAFFTVTLSNGGAERVVSYLSKEFPEEYNRYVIVSYLSEEHYEYGGQLINLDVKPADNVFGKASNYVKRIKKLRKIKKELNLDTTISFLDGANVINILSRVNDKIIISIRNHKSQELSGKKGAVVMKIMSRMYRMADKVVAISGGVEKDLLENFKVPKEKVQVIYNPIDIKKIEALANEKIDEKYEKVFEKPTIVNVGRLTNQKAQWSLIRAFSKAAEADKDVNLAILGQGELKDGLEKLIEEYNLQDRVFLLGFQSNPFKYVSRSSMFVLSSLFEGLGNVVLEALACNVPIISTDCKSGPREIFAPGTSLDSIIEGLEEHEYGMLVPVMNNPMNNGAGLSKEEEILADAIVSLLNDEQKREQYIAKSKMRVNDFEINNIINEWVKVIEE